MKLLYCPKCSDVVKLGHNSPRTCVCRASGGRYVDNLNAEIWGEAIPLGFANSSLMMALRAQPESGLGKEFTAFVIPRVCPTIKKLDEPPT